jgi:hypothetical protein
LRKTDGDGKLDPVDGDRLACNRRHIGGISNF